MPAIVTECIAEVEARGLTSEGIYRVPGSQDQIDALKLAFERGKVLDIYFLSFIHVCPLCPSKIYRNVFSAVCISFSMKNDVLNVLGS